jgi:hypothetical protein
VTLAPVLLFCVVVVRVLHGAGPGATTTGPGAEAVPPIAAPATPPTAAPTGPPTTAPATAPRAAPVKAPSPSARARVGSAEIARAESPMLTVLEENCAPNGDYFIWLDPRYVERLTAVPASYSDVIVRLAKAGCHRTASRPSAEARRSPAAGVAGAPVGREPFPRRFVFYP